MPSIKPSWIFPALAALIGGAITAAAQDELFVSKQLTLWRDAKIIELGRRRLTIRDRKALERLCNGERGGRRRPPTLSEKDDQV